jgi:DNA-binding NarL/FixJ family response regulator
MPLSPSETSQPTPVLLIEAEKSLALKFQDLLLDLFHESLDLAAACSLREGMTYLCSHRVSLILINLAVPDYKGLDAVHALRLTAPDSGLIAYRTMIDETTRLNAIRAGAHEVLSIADASPDVFRLTIECAMIRANLPRIGARSAQSEQPTAVPPRLLELTHALNNAMTSINGFADILLTRLPTHDPAWACAEQIKLSGKRAAALVQELRTPHESPSLLQPDATDIAPQAA